MRILKFSLAICAVLAAPAALSHSGVKDPQVLLRMNVMSDIGKDMKLVGDMAKGAVAFDVAELQAVSASLVGHAQQTVITFQSEASDPRSEALPAIWTEWDAFVALSARMEQASADLGKVKDLDGLRANLSALGKTCTACHEKYRINKN